MKFTNRKFVWLILSLISISSQAIAQEKIFDELILSESGKQSYQKLLKINLFAIGGIGYGGVTSEGERAFDVLIEEKESTAAFKSLAKNATVEGAFYGIFGLKMNGCDCFQENLDVFFKLRISGNETEKFSTQAGCMIFESAKSSEKKMIFDLYVKNFDQEAQWKQKLREQRKIKSKNGR